MRPDTCDDCLWSGHERCPYYKPLVLRRGLVPDDCTEALLRITAADVRAAILDEGGRTSLRAQAADNGIFQPAIVLALLERIEYLELQLRLADAESMEVGER